MVQQTRSPSATSDTDIGINEGILERKYIAAIWRDEVWFWNRTSDRGDDRCEEYTKEEEDENCRETGATTSLHQRRIVLIVGLHEGF